MSTTTTDTPSTGTPADERGLDLTEVIDAHLAAYCDPDAARRQATVARVWANDGHLLDPPFDGRGPAEIAAMTDAVLAHYPDHTFARTTAVDAHHAFARYGWALTAPDGAAAVTGTDFVEVDPTGRITRIVGFFGDPQPA